MAIQRNSFQRIYWQKKATLLNIKETVRHASVKPSSQVIYDAFTSHNISQSRLFLTGYLYETGWSKSGANVQLHHLSMVPLLHAAHGIQEKNSSLLEHAGSSSATNHTSLCLLKIVIGLQETHTHHWFQNCHPSVNNIIILFLNYTSELYRDLLTYYSQQQSGSLFCIPHQLRQGQTTAQLQCFYQTIVSASLRSSSHTRWDLEFW